jgi:hypothetical protein
MHVFVKEHTYLVFVFQTAAIVLALHFPPSTHELIGHEQSLSQVQATLNGQPFSNIRIVSSLSNATFSRTVITAVSPALPGPGEYTGTIGFAGMRSNMTWECFDQTVKSKPSIQSCTETLEDMRDSDGKDCFHAAHFSFYLAARPALTSYLVYHVRNDKSTEIPDKFSTPLQMQVMTVTPDRAVLESSAAASTVTTADLVLTK